MKRMRSLRFFSVVAASGFLAALLVACAERSNGEATEAAGSAAVTDILTMTRRDDGRFDVVCRDQTREIVTADDIRADRVCRGGGATGTRLGIIYGRSDSCE